MMHNYQLEIDQHELLERSIDRMEKMLEDEYIGDVRKRVDALGANGTGALAELNSAVSCIATALAKHEV